MAMKQMLACIRRAIRNDSDDEQQKEDGKMTRMRGKVRMTTATMLITMLMTVTLPHHGYSLLGITGRSTELTTSNTRLCHC